MRYNYNPKNKELKQDPVIKFNKVSSRNIWNGIIVLAIGIFSFEGDIAWLSILIIIVGAILLLSGVISKINQDD